MSIATRFVSSTARPRLDLKGCVFYAPLWRPDLGGSTFTSIGDGGIPTHLCTVTGATWGSQGRTFDSANNRIALDNLTGIPTGVDSTAIWVWYKPSTLTGIKRLYEMGAYGLEVSTASLYGFSNGGARASYTLPTALIWYFVLWTQNTTTGNTLYVKGGAETTVTNAYFATLGTAATGYIGNFSSLGRGANGVIGEVGQLNREPTSQEIQQIYLATKFRYV